MLQGMCELHLYLCMSCESVSVHILRTCATERLSKLCVCTDVAITEKL